MLVAPGKCLHVPDVHMSGLHQVLQVSPALCHLVVVLEQGNKDVPVLWVVEDVPLHHLGAVPRRLVLRREHLLDAQEELLVGLEGKVQSGEEGGLGGGGEGEEARERGRGRMRRERDL